MLRKNPGFALIAILSLGLGIGATTAVFGVLDAVVLRPMPVSNPERLVILKPQIKGKGWILVNPLFEGLRDQQQSLDGLFAVSDRPYQKAQFEDSQAPVYLRASSVSGAYFRTLRLAPAAGRFFTEEDDRNGCAAVVSHDLRFRLGQNVRLSNIDCTIVGVAPAGFRGHQPGFAIDL